MKKTQWLAILLLAFAVAATPAVAQLQSGNLYGTATDEGGAPLPGVTITLSGGGAPQVQITNAEGQFRFPGLAPGSYSLRADLDGFSSVDFPNIVVNVGRNTQIEVQLDAAVEETITVTSESPLLDERRISTGATVSQTELEKIPTARDPWAILQSTPGVLTDRLNVGGNESGQQSQYVGPGSGGDQSIWAVDGVVITDMGALGSSPAYYDFDSFEEMQVTTGGSDATIATGGVVLNMVTKRGTNEWRGTARYIAADDAWQSDLDFDRGELARGGTFNNSRPAGFNNAADQGVNNAQPVFRTGNRIVSVEDMGFEIGGPIVRDRLWVWGAYGVNEIDLLTIADVQDFTELETANVKLNAQPLPNNSATFFALQSDKIKIGRNAGPTRPQETTWNQSKFGDDPTAAKLEDTHIVSSSFYVTGLYSIVNGGFQLVPQGGIETSTTPAWRGPGNIWHNTFYLYQSQRPQEQMKADASAFFNTGSVAHELKFGAGLRQAEVASLTRWPGAGFSLYIGDPDVQYAILARDGFAASETEYTSVYVQDTLSLSNLTLNAGLRYDRQEGKNLARTVAANPFFPDLLPEVRYDGGPSGFSWDDLTPRLGATYAVGADRKTLLRASYSRFADQLGSSTVAWANPLYPGSYVYGYFYNDGYSFRPSDFVANEVVSGNYDPRTRGLLVSSAVDPDLEAPITDELLLSLEHALLPEFVVGLNLTWRQYSGALEGERLVFDGDAFATGNLDSVGRPHRRSDYVPVHRTGFLPDGSPYNLTYYELREGVTTRNGTRLENGDREQEFLGASAVFTKRLANRWMLRGNVSWQDWSWNSPDSENEDPTRMLPGLTGSAIPDGATVIQGSGTGSGSKGNVFVGSDWSYSVNGLYQVAPEAPWAFNVAANLNGRQGYPLLYFERFNRSTVQPSALGTPVLIEDVGDRRYEDIHMVDLRVEKELTFSDFGLTLGIDVFNALNEAYVMQRQGRLHACNTFQSSGGATACTANRSGGSSITGDHVLEITSPRIFRVGARLSFR
jgi:hypothetical protein